MSLWETVPLEPNETISRKRGFHQKQQRGVAGGAEPHRLSHAPRPPWSHPPTVTATTATPCWTHPSYYDVSSPHSSRQQTQRWGYRLAQARLLCNNNITNNNNNNNPCDTYQHDGTHVVYRQRDDWSRPQGYTACALLNHERVVGWDRSGALDIAQLPRFSTQTRPLGTVLVDSLPLTTRTMTRNRHSSSQASTGSSTILLVPKLYAFQAGDALAVGCGNVYHIVTSERIKSWGETRRLPRASVFHPSYTAYTLSGPRRKYERNLQQHPKYSLQAMAASTQTTTHYSAPLDYCDDTIFSMLPDWDLGLPKLPTSPYVPSIRRPIPQSSQWDFLETGSALLAARVDPQQDAFWIRLVDDRLYHPVVAIDRSPPPPSSWEEHVTAIALVSTHCLITAHVTCYPSQSNTSTTHHTSSSSAHDIPNSTGSRRQRSTTSVKLWDLRKASSLGTRDRENDSALMNTLSHPSFPLDIALLLDHDTQVPWSGGEGGEQGRDAVITGLSSGNGTVMVTAQTNQMAEHSRLHLGRCTWERIHRQQQQDNQESLEFLHSVARNHNVMACVEGSNDVTLVNISNPTSQSPSSPSRIQKRHVDGSHKDDRGSAWHDRRKLSTRLKDRLGLDTELSCLAMNTDGTAIVGGSTDGDLFVWRSD